MLKNFSYENKNYSKNQIINLFFNNQDRFNLLYQKYSKKQYEKYLIRKNIEEDYYIENFTTKIDNYFSEKKLLDSQYLLEEEIIDKIFLEKDIVNNQHLFPKLKNENLKKTISNKNLNKKRNSIKLLDYNDFKKCKKEESLIFNIIIRGNIIIP